MSKPKVVINQKVGMTVPNIAALSHTTADWTIQNGIHRPPPPPIPFPATWVTSTASLWSPSPAFNSSHTHAVIGPAPSLPPDLPVEKREMPVVGYRAWRYSKGFRLGLGHRVTLGSTGMSGVWVKGINQATCGASAFHDPPSQHCGCGFYVLRNLDEVEGHIGNLTDGYIVGAVMGWGRVIQHGTEGWRAEFAKIIGLLDCKFTKGQTRNTEEAAREYDVGMYSRPQLEAHVHEWGDPFD